MARKQDKTQNTKKQGKKATQKPLRMTLAALGVGLAWAALHMPPGMGMQASHLKQITWVIHALVAALLSLCVLEIAGAILGWLLRSSGSLLGAFRR